MFNSIKLSKSTRRKLKYALLYRFVLVVIRLSNLLPLRVWLSISGGVGRLVYFLSPRLKRQVVQHLSLAFKKEMSPEKIKKLSEQAIEMLGKNAGSVIRNFTLKGSEDFYKRTKIKGQQYAEEAFDSRRGVIFLTAHLGPFESIATDLSLRGFHPYIVGTPLKDRNLNTLLMESRTKFGATLIERGKDTFRIMKNISNGGTMAILIDQDTRVKSVFVKFFGIECSTPVGATLIALRTGAAVIPVFARLNKNGTQEINYYPEIELERTGDEENDLITNTQRFTMVIENEIRKYPEQWVWMHERWKTKNNAVKKVVKPVETAMADY
ncbi:lysophospholipid acyltransferase family protein [Chryseosolibacter indicus]|uniref:Lysophospholipid acyltransferase family protein n=1 Tax=Chryseosolibacter indicus TaxID=2782351 RepID=A0ABS5VKH1_9BACT|nr:lysophospholipid acyltransferase family protein [Chryseosolibacter indicus]MBT1701940.1 lysophospholipid acyltransferase family protein [Chryseosolibacter indicus]